MPRITSSKTMKPSKRKEQDQLKNTQSIQKFLQVFQKKEVVENCKVSSVQIEQKSESQAQQLPKVEQQESQHSNALNQNQAKSEKLQINPEQNGTEAEELNQKEVTNLLNTSKDNLSQKDAVSKGTPQKLGKKKQIDIRKPRKNANTIKKSKKDQKQMPSNNGVGKIQKGVNEKSQKQAKGKKNEKDEVEIDHMSGVEEIVQAVQKQDPIVSVKNDTAAIMDDHQGDSLVLQGQNVAKVEEDEPIHEESASQDKLDKLLQLNHQVNNSQEQEADGQNSVAQKETIQNLINLGSNQIQIQNDQNLAPFDKNDIKCYQQNNPEPQKCTTNVTKKDKRKKQVQNPKDEAKDMSDSIKSWKMKKQEFLDRLDAQFLLPRDDLTSNFQDQLQFDLEGEQFIAKYFTEADFKNQISLLNEAQQKQIFDSIKSYHELQDKSSFQLSNDDTDSLFKLFAKVVDSSQLTLEKLVPLSNLFLLETLKYLLENEAYLTAAKQLIEDKVVDLSSLITLRSEYKNYGIPKMPEKHLCFWEISVKELYLSGLRQKNYMIEKQARQKFNIKVKCIERVITLIDKLSDEKDIVKIQEEIDKLDQITLKENQLREKDAQKKREKELKLQIEVEKQAQKLEAKKQKDVQLEEEKQRKIQQELEKEQEKKEKQAELERIRLDKIAKLEAEKKARQDKILQEKQQRLEKLEKEKQFKLAEKERKLKEEQEKEAERLRKKPNIAQFFSKQNQDGLESQKQTCEIQTKSQEQNQQQIIKNAHNKYENYKFQSSAVKKQRENLIKNWDFMQERKNTIEIMDETEEENQEDQNKQSICKLMKMLRQLDPLIGEKDKYEITYVKMRTKQDIMMSPSKVSCCTPQSETHKSSKQVIFRKKCIIIEDSFKSVVNSLNFKSQILTCRNPFKMDAQVVNYDMDSEDEWAEENGEDLQEGKASDDEDEDELEDEEANQGFIVEDDYLSVSEMNYSNLSKECLDQSVLQADMSRRKAIQARNRESKQQMKEQSSRQGPQIFIQCDNKEMMEQYQAIEFASTTCSEFPIDIGKIKLLKQTNSNEEDKKQGFDPNAILEKLDALVLMVHGSFEAKPKLIDDFVEQNPECSKNSVEKKMKEFFVKDKRNDDPRQRYYAKDEVLVQLKERFPGGIENEELVAVSKSRSEPILLEIRQAQEEIDETRRKDQQEKDHEKMERELMRQEEQYQRDLKKQIVKLQKEREKAELQKQIDDEKQKKQEEKQRCRDLKLKEKLEEQETKKKLRLQKESEKLAKKSEKDNAKKPPIAKEATKEKPEIVQMLKKRKAPTSSKIESIPATIPEIEQKKNLKAPKVEQPDNNASKTKVSNMSLTSFYPMFQNGKTNQTSSNKNQTSDDLGQKVDKHVEKSSHIQNNKNYNNDPNDKQVVAKGSQLKQKQMPISIESKKDVTPNSSTNPAVSAKNLDITTSKNLAQRKATSGNAKPQTSQKRQTKSQGKNKTKAVKKTNGVAKVLPQETRDVVSNQINDVNFEK